MAGNAIDSALAGTRFAAMTGPTPTALKLVKQPLLIVDDDEDIRSQMKWALVDQYDVLVAEDRPSAVAALRERQPKVVLLDLGLPPNPADTTEGFAALAEVLSLRPFTKVIIISGQAEKANALRAIGEGAYDFLPKPVEMEELKQQVVEMFGNMAALKTKLPKLARRKTVLRSACLAGAENAPLR